MAALSETQICNMALARVGSKRINDIDEDSVPAIHCRTHYEPTRDALLRSHWWGFASARAVLAQDASDPDFEWDNQFILPADCLRVKDVYEDNNTPLHTTTATYAIEGERLLTNESAISIRYIKRVEDPTKFDALFVEVLVLQLAIRFAMSLAEDKVLKRDLLDELSVLMARARTVDRSETNRAGRDDRDRWLDARLARTSVT